MLSLRLKKILSLLDSQDKVVDIGCDHGYLGIYAIKEKLVKSIILTDIKESALSMARKNVKNSNLDIPLIVSDGLNNINASDINTVVVSGMGTSTILHILNNKEKLVNVTKLILQSNNNLDTLREEVTKLGYQLTDEITVNDKNIWYVICLFKKNENPKLDDITRKYGLLKKDKQDYYEYIINSKNDILKKLEKSHDLTLKEQLKTEIMELTKLLEKCRIISTD